MNNQDYKAELRYIGESLYSISVSIYGLFIVSLGYLVVKILSMLPVSSP